jgi:hypothetical protein
MTRKVLTLKQARQVAWQGKAEEAVPLLRLYADKGDASAAASLAELLAFQGVWSECLERAGAFIAKPQSVYAGNIFDDMIGLIARAGRETGQWDRILDLTQAAEQRVEENIADYTPPKQEAQRKRYHSIFQGLRAYVERQGAVALDFRQIFGVTALLQTEQDAAYQLAMRNIFQHQPKLRNDPAALSRHQFALAQVFHQEAEGIRLYEEGHMPAEFDRAIFVAKAYVHRKQPELAWEIIWKHAHRWRPLDPAQVAPVVLLMDGDLANLMDRDRCKQVLHLPRGPEALPLRPS